MTAITKLYQYFGVTGIASIITWIASLVLFARYARSKGRTQRYLMALGVAMLGLLLAKINSSNVNEIRADMSEEINAVRERLGRSYQAEDDSEKENGGPINIYEEAAQEAAPMYAYRAHGKVERAEGKKREDQTEATETEKKKEISPYVRMMKSVDVHRANRIDRINLFLARFTMWLALALVVADYLGRFNKTFNAYFPLPIACRFIDSLCSKTLAVYVYRMAPDALRDYLERVVRKGETFIYFGKEDPWQNKETTDHGPRLARRSLPAIWRGLGEGGTTDRKSMLPRLRIRGVGLWPLEKMTFASRDTEFDSDSVFESAWFHRYCFVVTDAELAREWLNDLVDFLLMRYTVLATARRTVNIVWNIETPVSEETLNELVFLCHEINYKLMFISAADLAKDVVDQFDEIYYELPGKEQTIGFTR